MAVTAPLALSSASFARWSAWIVSCSRRQLGSLVARPQWRPSRVQPPSCELKPKKKRGLKSQLRYHDKMVDRWWPFFHEPMSVGDGISEDPPLRRESSQVGQENCKIGEVSERELVLVVSVRCGNERDMTRGWAHQGLSHACSRD